MNTATATFANASFVVRLGVVDSETNELQSIDIYKDAKGRLIGVDSTFLSADESPIYSPFTREELNLD